MAPKRTAAAVWVLWATAMIVAACSGGDPTLAPPPTSPSSTGSQPPGTTTAMPTTTDVPLRSMTLAASGDILLHNLVIQSARANAGGSGYDFRPMFDDVRGLLSNVDLALCHQETPISADNKVLTIPRTLVFNAPHEIADALADAGFDGCDAASNHTYDHGLRGVTDTLDVLDGAGLVHTGPTRNETEATQPPILDVNGIKVGYLGFSYTIFNEGGPSQNVPADAPWLESMLWPKIGIEGVLAQARAIKARGAEFVVVAMHWGAQYVREPTADQRSYAKAMLESPEVDLILGTHAHLVQPCEKIGDKYVAYGMGNFLSNQSPTQDSSLRSANQDGVVTVFSIAETAPGHFATTAMNFAPTWVVIPGHHIELATPDRHGDSFARTVDAMGALGAGACDASPVLIP